MDGGDVKVFVKSNWPYLLGGAIGLFLVVKYAGGSGGGGGGDGGQSVDPQFMAMMNAQAAQQAGQNAQLQLADKSRQDQTAIAMRSLEVQNAQGNNQTQVAWLKAQGDAALKTASASAMLVDALNKPAQSAITAGGQVTAAGLAASGMIGVAGFQAQAQTVTAAANVLNTNTMAQTSLINASLARDTAIAKTNAGVISDALKNNASVNDSYYGAMSSIADSFMSQGQVNYGGGGGGGGQMIMAPMQQPMQQPSQINYGVGNGMRFWDDSPAPQVAAASDGSTNRINLYGNDAYGDWY